jgi:uncharacterized membrane protein
MIAGHNLLDGITATDFGALGFIWNFLHQPALLTVTSGTKLYALYPLIPWVGVMAAGYALGPILKADATTRVGTLVWLGAAITLGFLMLRLSDLYGDPASWVMHDGAFTTFLSLLNCEKYPPSLLYLMMTLGPALILLAVFERARGPVAGFITTIGRVPFLYYVAHIFLIHALAVGFAVLTTGSAAWLLGGLPGAKPAGYGLSLPGIYAVWLAVVVMLYPLCRWFAGLKQRRPEWWWSYL